MAGGRYLIRAFDTGMDVGMMLNGEQSTGDRPARGRGGSLRKVRAGLDGTLRAQRWNFTRAWIQGLGLCEQIREGKWVFCRACVRHHWVMSLFPRGACIKPCGPSQLGSHYSSRRI